MHPQNIAIQAQNLAIQPQSLGIQPPNVYVQHLPNPGMTASFAHSFQQQTGRTLQYVASIPAPFMSHLQPLTQPQLNYITPQGIIINQPQFHHFAPSGFQPGAGVFPLQTASIQVKKF